MDKNLKINTVVIDSELTSVELVGGYLRKIPNINVMKTFPDIQSGYDFILKNAPNLIVIDISENPSKVLEEIQKLQIVLKNTKFVVLSYNINSELVVQALRAGAREFLIKPLIEKDFANSIEKIKDLIIGNIDDRSKCKVISVFSNKGGIGKTSIATNIAVEIANLTKERVALIDLNLQMGDITTFLDLTPAFNTSYVINNLEKIDEEFLLSTLEKYKDTELYVLADPPDIQEAQGITRENITKLLNVLKGVFSYIIIDTASNFDEKTITALDNSDLILLTAILNLPSVRNLQRCFELFKRLEYPKDKIKIIANRVMENDEIRIEDVEDALNHPVYFKIPNNYFTLINAINKGVPLCEVNSGSNISKSFRKLAAMLSDNFTYSATGGAVKRDEQFNILNIFKKKD